MITTSFSKIGLQWNKTSILAFSCLEEIETECWGCSLSSRQIIKWLSPVKSILDGKGKRSWNGTAIASLAGIQLAVQELGVNGRKDIVPTRTHTHAQIDNWTTINGFHSRTKDHGHCSLRRNEIVALCFIITSRFRVFLGFLNACKSLWAQH